VLVFKARPRRDPARLPTLTNSERRMMRVLGEAMNEVRAQVIRDEGKLLDAVMHRPADTVANMITVEPWLEAQATIEEELFGEVVSAGQRVKLPSIRKATFSYRFDAERAEASRWAAKEAGALIVEIVQEQQTVVRDYVSRALLGEFTPQQVARGLRDTIGLTNQQTGWVENFRQRQITDRMAAGRTFDQAVADSEKATNRYHDRIHKYRTETIARTEILRASNEGRREAWEQGVQDGFIGADWVKIWSTEFDDRTCEECSPLDGETAPVLGDFPWGDPPLHPNCRCTLLLDEPQQDGEDFSALSDDELEELINDLIDETIEDDAEPSDPEEIPEWAQEAGLQELLDELPENREDIGYVMEDEAALIRRWENEHNPYGIDIEEIRMKGIEADEYMQLVPALETEIDKNIDEIRGIWQAAGGGLPPEGTPEYERYFELSRINQELKEEITEAQKAVSIRDEAEQAIAEVKQRIPTWMDELPTPNRVVDIDPVTGEPGETLKRQSRAITEIGTRIEDEVTRRLPENLKGLTEKGEMFGVLSGKFTEADLRRLSEIRMQVLADLRPMDRGFDNFASMSQSEADRLQMRTTARAINPATDAAMRAVEQSLNLYPSKWIQSMNAVGRVDVFETDRGFTIPGRNIIGVSGQDSASMRSIAGHEIGHRMEEVVPGMRPLQYAYMWERQRFPGSFGNVSTMYGGEERYVMGTTFREAYTAKIYEPSIQATTQRLIDNDQKLHFEVFTTGTQAAFPMTKDDLRYGDDDGAFQRWTLGILATL
jgi:SPP1 gp7 family putative phage head morphogenesis protein